MKKILLQFLLVILVSYPLITPSLALENPPENGIYETFYPDGVVMTRATYIDGVLQGPAFEYHSNGQIDVMENYTNGKLDGEWKSYYEDGSLEAECVYENGMQQETERKYHPNGNLAEEIHYKDDKKHGWYREFDEDGALNNEVNFVQGERFGEEKHFHKNGRLKLKFDYEEDFPTKQTTYNNNGEMIRTSKMPEKIKMLERKRKTKIEKAKASSRIISEARPSE